MRLAIVVPSDDLHEPGTELQYLSPAIVPEQVASNPGSQDALRT